MRYVGREIPDVFVLGYGLHRADLYRNVPRVVVADRELVRGRPDAYVDCALRLGDGRRGGRRRGAGEARC